MAQERDLSAASKTRRKAAREADAAQRREARKQNQMTDPSPGLLTTATGTGDAAQLADLAAAPLGAGELRRNPNSTGKPEKVCAEVSPSKEPPAPEAAASRPSVPEGSVAEKVEALIAMERSKPKACLLYTSDAADE